MTEIILDPSEIANGFPDVAQLTNLVTNPKPASATGYTHASTAGNNLNSGGSSSYGVYGGRPALQVQTTGSAVAQGVSFRLDQTFDAGVTYRGSVLVRGTFTLNPLQVLLGDSSTDVGLSVAVPRTTDYQLVEVEWTPSATRTKASLTVRTSVAAADTFDVAEFVWVRDGDAGTYFDGDTEGYRWAGLPHGSATVPETRKRVPLSLNQDAIRVGDEGIDWGDALIEQFLADSAQGSTAVDFRLPNRQITIPLEIGATAGGEGYDDALVELQQKVALIQREGGFIQRGTGLYADIVNATLKLPDLHSHQSYSQALLTLEAIPDFYEDWQQASSEDGTDIWVASGATSAAFTVTDIEGDHPGRVRIVIGGNEDAALRGIVGGIRSRNYDDLALAQLKLEAHLMTLQGSATTGVATPTDAAAAVVSYQALTTDWTTVLLTDIDGAGPLKHHGSYRVLARVYSPNAAPPRVRLLWQVGELSDPNVNAAYQIPDNTTWHVADLGEIRLEQPPIGDHYWRGLIQAQGDAGGEDFHIEVIELVPVDDGYFKLTAPDVDVDMDSPPTPAVVYVDGLLEVRSDGVFRETSGGSTYTRLVPYGDLPRIPPSGLEDRTVEFFIKGSRGDLTTIADAGVDYLVAEVFYRPSFLFPIRT